MTLGFRMTLSFSRMTLGFRMGFRMTVVAVVAAVVDLVAPDHHTGARQFCDLYNSASCDA